MLVREGGFTLPEVLLAMAFGSLIAIAAAKTYPLLRQQTLAQGQHYRLEVTLRQIAFGIEKDLRRAGFCAGQCTGKPLLIGNAEGEATGNCVIVTYDLNRNGRWEDAGGSDAEQFGYRLRRGALETQRGVTHCRGNGWERVFDQDDIIIEAFTVAVTPGMRGKTQVALALTGRSAFNADIRRSMSWAIALEAR